MSQHPLSFVYMDKRNIQVFIMGVDANQTWTLTFIRPGWKRFSMPSGGEEDSIWRESKIRLTLLFMLRPRQVFNSSCKTQNSGLRSKEEKPRDPINQPSRCNTHEGLLSVAQTVTLISWEAEHPEQQIGQAFYMQKAILSAYYIRVTK